MNTRLASSALASAIFLLGSSIANANEFNFDYYGYTDDSPPNLDLSSFVEKDLNYGFTRNEGYLYTINSETKEYTLRSTQAPFWGNFNSFSIDPATKKLFVESAEALPGFTEDSPSGRGDDIIHIFDPRTNTWSSTCAGDDSYEWGNMCEYKVPTGFSWDSTANRSVNVGDPDNPTVVNGNGISGIITHNSSTGITSLGANSLKLQETSTQQKMWGTNASGESVPINITNGSKLLIDGRDVDQAIDNVGALSAALTGLPTVPENTPLSCGVGVGAHSGSNAFSGGCASKVNERLTLNYAASIIPAKQDYQGTDNSWSGRAGFVFKLGKVHKPTLISMKEKKVMQSKITELSASNTEIKATNEKIQSQNKELQAKVNSFESKNQELRNLLAMQNERLEKIEQIALSNQKDEKTAFSFLNVSNLFSSMRSFLISSN